MTAANPALPEGLAECVVQDALGRQQTIGHLCAGRAVLLLFVRHFGCIGCAENIGLLAPRFQELADLGIRILIIGCGAPMFIEGFRERHLLLHTPAEVYVDETLAAHRAAELSYGHWGGFGPRGLLEMGRAFVRGHVPNGTQGDTKQQAGALLVDAGGTVRLHHQNRSLGDHVSGSLLVEASMKMVLRANPGVV